MEFINWIFSQKPTLEQMYKLLETIPAWNAPNAKKMSEYAEFVVPMKGWNKESKSEEWRMYCMVSGKLKIMADAHFVDGVRIPIVEQCELRWIGNMVVASGTITSPIYGTVFEAATGLVENGKGADSTNPVENCLTSFHGRAATSLCGAGIMPYSGMASAEEMATQETRSELVEAGMKVINTNVNPKVETANEPSASPAQSVEASGKTAGGLGVEAATNIVAGMKKLCDNDDDFIDTTLAFFKENAMGCTDRNSVEAAAIALTAREMGKLTLHIKKLKGAK